jgi:hypothetical protein
MFGLRFDWWSGVSRRSRRRGAPWRLPFMV